MTNIDRVGAVLGLVLTLALGTPGQARAEAAPESDSSREGETSSGDQVQGGDIVRLDSGAMFRGTIAELVPDEYVVLVLMTGESRRFEMAQVRYAGPESGDPEAAPPPAPAPPSAPTPFASPAPDAEDRGRDEERGFTVHIRSDRQDLTVYRVGPSRELSFSYAGSLAPTRVRADSFEEICEVPCTTRLPGGEHTLLAMPTEQRRNRGMMTSASPMSSRRSFELGRVEVNQDLDLRLRSESRRGRRIGGWLLFGLGNALGLGLTIGGLAQSTEECESYGYCRTEPDPNWALAAPGLGLVLVSTIVGLVLGLQRDLVWLEGAER